MLTTCGCVQVLDRLNALPFDPTTNSDPLHLNSSSGPLVTECPTLENSAENGKKRRRTSLLPELRICTSRHTPAGTNSLKITKRKGAADTFINVTFVSTASMDIESPELQCDMTHHIL
ncbi:hypothetical protein D9C73_006216 [Collichthys lucidus]|uniref:Uncharacterized protein n=1 Tax=Collichthys lucidus TaxID=240159 RepID=A0A4U5UCH2_COLLU|nr:hypothetical protein D9C73_006216 [Collichthys lucidus]